MGRRGDEREWKGMSRQASGDGGAGGRPVGLLPAGPRRARSTLSGAARLRAHGAGTPHLSGRRPPRLRGLPCRAADRDPGKPRGANGQTRTGHARAEHRPSALGEPELWFRAQRRAGRRGGWEGSARPLPASAPSDRALPAGGFRALLPTVSRTAAGSSREAPPPRARGARAPTGAPRPPATIRGMPLPGGLCGRRFRSGGLRAAGAGSRRQASRPEAR